MRVASFKKEVYFFFHSGIRQTVPGEYFYKFNISNGTERSIKVHHYVVYIYVYRTCVKKWAIKVPACVPQQAKLT